MTVPNDHLIDSYTHSDTLIPKRSSDLKEPLYCLDLIRSIKYDLSHIKETTLICSLNLALFLIY